MHRELARLSAVRGRFRMRRTINRMRSPRRIIATSLAVVFFALYLANGIFVLSAREAADPALLRLWLSGGMVIYAVYHCLRCAWASSVVDLELTPAESLWLGGAPMRRSSLAVYHVGNTVVPAILKTLLLAVVLARDVWHLELLLVGVFTSLVFLETLRLIVARWAAGLSDSGRLSLRIAITLVASAICLQVIASVAAMTPFGSATLIYLLNIFQGLGQAAACDTVQWFSLPWVAGAELAVTEVYQPITLLQLIAAAAVLPLSILVLVRVDAWSLARRNQREIGRLTAGKFKTHATQLEAATTKYNHRGQSRVDQWIPEIATDAFALISRQWVSIRRYQGTILFSFLIPTLLCLSPLATGQTSKQWFQVVSGIAMCTLLLAPPALKLDFRRDLRRMLLLRSLPIKPMSMVVGQLTLPIVITWLFQWFTIAIAAHVAGTGLYQIVLWTGMLSALAVLTFAAENVLFLAFPHHERSQGVAMMIRAKLMFLGKATVIAIAIGMLVVWAEFCNDLPPALRLPTLIGGAIAATWATATAALLIASSCWRRFDFAFDIPPE